MGETIFVHSIVQPNPGWGTLCESCIHRQAALESGIPCEKALAGIVNLERTSIGGQDVTIRHRFGEDFQETCDLFRAV